MGTQSVNGSLYTSVTGGLATLEFGHPASNSFTSDLLGRLTQELESLSKKNDVKVILLRSEGNRAFCAGASFDELVSLQNQTEATTFFSGFAHVLNAMRTCSKPIICRVQGKAVGGGVGLISACDYVMATEKASIRLSEISIGIAPLVIAPAVARKAGISGLSELSLAPKEWKSAYWAKEKGLFARVFESIEELDSEIDFFAQNLASYPTDALVALKQALWENTEHWEELLLQRAAQTGKLSLSEETKTTLAKFKK